MSSVIQQGSEFLSALQPTMTQAGAQLARQVGSAYNSKLRGIGAGIVTSTVYGVADAMPPLLRQAILTRKEYLEAAERESTLPAWAQQITDPIIQPIADGAKAEAKRRAGIVAPRAFMTASLLVLTIFSVGYIVGVKKTEKRAGIA